MWKTRVKKTHSKSTARFFEWSYQPPKPLISSRLNEIELSQNVNETHQSDFGSVENGRLEASANQQDKKRKLNTSWSGFMNSSKEAPKDRATSAKSTRTKESSKAPSGSAKKGLRTSLSTEKHLLRIESSVRLKSSSVEKTIPPPPVVPAPPPKVLSSNFKTVSSSIKSKVVANGSNVKPATAPSFSSKISKLSRNAKKTPATTPKRMATAKPSMSNSKAGSHTSSPRESSAVKPTSPSQTQRPAKSLNQASKLPVPVRNPDIKFYSALAKSKIPFKFRFALSSSVSNESIESDSISEIGLVENKNDSFEEDVMNRVDATSDDISVKNEERLTTFIKSHTQSTMHSKLSFIEEGDKKTEKIEKEENLECAATDSVESNEILVELLNQSDSTKVKVDDDTKKEVTELVENFIESQ
ncbi:hypothetical protein HK098_005730 [Nowakowskiella sp. JEL0407]|nr:hypothetical protein HK098_005730 [Nowakowskiella sp. JEL0407]